MADVADRLAGQLPDARAVSVEGLDRVDVGHSAETLLMTARPLSFAAMAPAIPFLTQLGLGELGIDAEAAR